MARITFCVVGWYERKSEVVWPSTCQRAGVAEKVGEIFVWLSKMGTTLFSFYMLKV